MNKTITKIIFLLIILILILGVAGYLRIENNKSKSELFLLKKNIKTQELLPDENQIQKQSVVLNSKIKKITEFLFDGNNPIVFIEKIEKLAQNNNVSLFVDDANSVPPDENKKFGGQITLNVSAEGKLDNIKKFIFDVENMGEIVSVEEFRISRTEDNIWQLLFIINANTK